MIIYLGAILPKKKVIPYLEEGLNHYKDRKEGPKLRENFLGLKLEKSAMPWDKKCNLL